MRNLLCRFLPEGIAAHQRQEWERESKGMYHGLIFNLQPLMDAYSVVINALQAKNWHLVDRLWCKGVGGEQRKLPSCVIDEIFLSPSSSFVRRSESHRVDFSDVAPRPAATREWLIARGGGSLGENFAWYRCGRVGSIRALVPRIFLFSTSLSLEASFVKSLLNYRNQQLNLPMRPTTMTSDEGGRGSCRIM